MAVEVEVVAAWLGARLGSNAVGVANRIFEGVAPPNTAYPLVRFAYMGGSDVNTLNGARVMQSGIWLVAAVAQASNYSALTTIAALIDSRLHRQTLTLADDGIVLACVREQPFRQIENQDGVIYRSLGGLYRIYAQ